MSRALRADQHVCLVSLLVPVVAPLEVLIPSPFSLFFNIETCVLLYFKGNERVALSEAFGSQMLPATALQFYVLACDRGWRLHPPHP